MKIYLLDINPFMTSEWSVHFHDISNVEICLDEFNNFMDTHHEIDCIVSPANSYGVMDGGYDKAITNYFGIDLMKRVQKYIIDNYYSEQPVGSSFIIDIPNTNKKLIHTPTMRVPSRILDPSIIYQCMRTTLITAIKNNVKNIVIPAFGGATGGVGFYTIAEEMRKGLDQINNPIKTISSDILWRKIK